MTLRRPLIRSGQQPILALALSATLAAFGCAAPQKVEPPKPVVAAPVVQAPVTSAAEIQVLFDNAVAATRTTPPDYAAAAAGFARVVEIAPEFLEAHLNLGWTLEHSGDPAGAEAAYQSALRLQSAHPKVLLSLGALHLRQGRADQAVGLFEQLLAQQPDSIELKQNLAIAYRMKKDYTAAHRYTKEVLTREAKSISALNLLGLIYFDQGNYDMAEWVFTKANKFEANHPEILTNLGLTHLVRGDVMRAMVNFQAAAKAAPRHIPSRLNLGAIYLEYLNYRESGTQFEEVLRIDPNSIEARFGYAGSLFGQQQYEAAAGQYQQILLLDPQSATANLRLGRLYGEFLRDQQQALTYLRRYVQLANPPQGDPIVEQVRFLEAQEAKGWPKGFDEETEQKPHERPAGAADVPGLLEDVPPPAEGAPGQPVGGDPGAAAPAAPLPGSPAPVPAPPAEIPPVPAEVPAPAAVAPAPAPVAPAPAPVAPAPVPVAPTPVPVAPAGQ